jgi:beta-propeller repeat-containing protein
MNSSKTKALLLVALALSGAIAFLNLAGTKTSRATAGIDRAKPGSSGAPDSAARIREAYGKLPLAFEQNRGQASAATNFQARGAGYTLSLSATEATFLMARGPDESSTVLRMNLFAANPAAAVEGLNELEGKVNYLIGNDAAQWRTNVPTFGRVRYREVYPGVDVVYYGNQRRLEYDFVVAPGSNPGAIALEFPGTPRIEVEAATGDLLLGVGEKTVRQHKPVAYQEINGARREIEGRYAIRSGGRVGFEVGEYDARSALIIDPVLVYSTFLGGNGTGENEVARSIAVDSSGNAYVAGYTDSTDFPIANAVQGTQAGAIDVFVSKLNAAGSGLVYSTYLGGNAFDGCYGIAVDSAGNVYLAGSTLSSNFPTVNPVQATRGSNNSPDAFVAKLNAAGSALVYSTYLGGSNFDGASGIAVDSSGNAYVTGGTGSTNFPTANALQSALSSPTDADAFITKFNAAGSALVYSTYLGGIGEDHANSIAVDSTGSVYVAGYTYSTDFPTANAIQAARAGDRDAFVTKVNAAGSALVYSTYLGGSDMDYANGIAVDSAGSAYVTGATFSTNFPTANAMQNILGGQSDAFVTKLNAAGSALVYSTYLGGNGYDIGTGIALDGARNAYVIGWTVSTNFPTVNAFQSAIGHVDFDDVFVTKLNAAGSALVYSSYLGGTDYDNGFGIAVDSAGNAYLTGSTSSRCFPTTTGAFDTTWGFGFPDAFATKVSETAQPSTLTPCPSQLLDIATRTRVLTGDGVLIAGFIVTGNDSAGKRMLIRGIGPSLNVPGALANPVLELYDSFAGNPPFVTNDDWITNRAEVEATGIPPSNDRESAIVITLQPGAFTVVLRGQNNGVGIGVVEVYDLDGDAPAILSNISGRGSVGTGDDVMIGGFIVGGSGSADARVVVRGLGPSLGAFGVTGALQDPIIDLKNANGTTLMSNDDWQQGQPTEINSLGLAPSDTRESALVIAVPHGNYTAILRGKGNATGIGVVEVYHVP